MERPDSVQREPVFAGPIKELATGPCTSQPGIPVPDCCGEEFNVGIGSPWAGRGNQLGYLGRRRQRTSPDRLARVSRSNLIPGYVRISQAIHYRRPSGMRRDVAPPAAARRIGTR